VREFGRQTAGSSEEDLTEIMGEGRERRVLSCVSAAAGAGAAEETDEAEAAEETDEAEAADEEEEAEEAADEEEEAEEAAEETDEAEAAAEEADEEEEAEEAQGADERLDALEVNFWKVMLTPLPIPVAALACGVVMLFMATVHGSVCRC
jgi:hypothetical protein